MRIGVHPTPKQPLTPPLPIHVEAVAWFSPAIPPADQRTVILRVAGHDGSPEAFYESSCGSWISMLDGYPIANAVEAWAERPTGPRPTGADAQQPGGAIVAKLAKSDGLLGFGVRLTAAGQALPPGSYELQLVPTNQPRTDV